MGVEVAASEVRKVNGEANGVVHEMENGKVNESEPITFGSQGVDEPIAFGSQGVDEQPAKGEVKNALNSKNASDEWPAEPQVHYFWIVKYRPYEDPKLKGEIEKLEKDVEKKSAAINQIYEELNPKRAAKDDLYALLDSLWEEKSQYQEFIKQKREEIKPLAEALGDLRGSGREKGPGICSSEEELNRIIRSLEYRIQHESMPLKEEKQILREIKDLEATRPRVITEGAAKAKRQESYGQKEAIQDQVKLLGTDLDGVKKQREAVQAKRTQLQGQAKDLKLQIEKLKDEAKRHKEKKNATIESIRELRSKRDEGNKVFYENRALLNSARELAAKKDVKALEELVNTEVEKFMSEWNGSKAFRSNYEKRILLSLDMRQLSRDGRMRNFDEKPLVKVESPALSETVTSISTGKTPKEIPKITSKAENVPTEKAQNEPKKGKKESKAPSEREIEDAFVVEKPKEDVSKDKEVDAAKLKEMKKEEEKEKQRQALERKKKLQEKAAAKAALRAQKEAEKKQKEREKKLKKKGSSVQPTNEEEPSETPEGDEAEKSDNVEEPSETPAPLKAKGQKETVIRHRKSVKTRAALPKAVLKKKKSPNYLLWGSAAAAAVVVLLLIVFGYNYLQKPQVVS